MLTRQILERMVQSQFHRNRPTEVPTASRIASRIVVATYSCEADFIFQNRENEHRPNIAASSTEVRKLPELDGLCSDVNLRNSAWCRSFANLRLGNFA